MDYRTAPPPHPLVFVRGNCALAIDRESGRVMWQYQASKTLSRLTFADDRVFLLDFDCVVHCLDAGTGRLAGTVRVGPPSASSAALLADGANVFVATSDGVTALGPDGRILWRVPTPENVVASIALAGLGLPGSVVQPDFN
jgi:outer membrane protein assembly factor BamB